jgi:hypothetical protein
MEPFSPQHPYAVLRVSLLPAPLYLSSAINHGQNESNASKAQKSQPHHRDPVTRYQTLILQSRSGSPRVCASSPHPSPYTLPTTAARTH